MAAQLVIIVIIITFDGGFLDFPVHALDLAIGQAVFNIIFITNTIKDVPSSHLVYFPVGELNVIVRENGMDFVGKHFDKITKKMGCNNYLS